MLGQFEEALADFGQTTELWLDSELRSCRGTIYKAFELYDEALTDHFIALRINRNIRALFTFCATLWPSLKYIVSSEANIKNKNDADKIMQEYERNLAHYTMTIERDLANPAAYIKRGDIYYKLQRYQEARNDYSQAIEIDPGKVGVYYQRCYTNLRLYHYNEGLVDFNWTQGKTKFMLTNK